MESPTPFPSIQRAKRKRRPITYILFALCALVIVGCALAGLWQFLKGRNSNSEQNTTPSPLVIETTTTGGEESPSPPPVPEPANLDFAFLANFKNTSVLHIWLRPRRDDNPAILYATTLSTSDQLNISQFDPLFQTRETGPPTWFKFAQLEPEFEGTIELSWSGETTEVSYIYVYEPEEVKSKGIRLVFVSELAKNPPMSKSFHFRPPLGWTNDPNGFSRTGDGLYHLFYQHYPHSRRWQSMHWGHAISTDLVNWADQPIFLQPDYSECGTDCGYYSGSAVPVGHGGLQLFFTDHNSTRDLPEVQRTVYTEDTILPSNDSKIFLEEQPDVEAAGLSLRLDFRDPNVFFGPEGYYYMTLGSGDTKGKGGVVLLYRTREKSNLLSGWEFQNVLLSDNNFGTEVCECSGIVPLSDPTKKGLTYFALLYARMSSRDDDGRRNLSPITLGTFDGTHFEKKHEQELDFAAGSYGFQAFYDQIADEALLIGWLANWPDWDRQSDFSTSLTLPWLIKWSGNLLLFGPHPNVLAQLRGEELDGKALLRGNIVGLPNGTAYIRLAIDYYYFYNGIFLQLNHEDYQQLGVKVTNMGLEIVKTKHGDAPNRRFLAANARPDIVHIYIDHDSMEVFGEVKNDGMPRWAGTTRLTSVKSTQIDSAQLITTDRYNYVMNGCQIWSMKPAKFMGRS